MISAERANMLKIKLTIVFNTILTKIFLYFNIFCSQ